MKVYSSDKSLFTNSLGEEFYSIYGTIPHWYVYDKGTKTAFYHNSEVSDVAYCVAVDNESRYITEIAKTRAGAIVLLANYLEKNKE